MISGVFAKALLTESDYKKLFSHIFVPYFIINLIGIFASPYKTVFLLQPAVETWFLLDYILWSIALPFLVNIRWAVFISILITLLVGMTSLIGDTFALGRFFYYLPFFLFGFLYGRRVLDYSFPYQKSLCFFVITGIFLGCVYINPYIPAEFYYEHTSYGNLGLSNSIGIIIRFTHILAQFISTIAFIWLIPKTFSLFSVLGQKSLYVYMTNIFFISLFYYLGFYNTHHSWALEFVMVPLVFILTLFLSTDFWYRIAKPILQPNIEKWIYKNK